MRSVTSKRQRSLRILANILIVSGLVFALQPLTVHLFGTFEQNRLEKEFDSLATQSGGSAIPRAETKPPARPLVASKKAVRQKSKPKATVLPALAHTPLPGSLFARLRIPKIDLEAIVVEGTDHDNLRRGPGHLPGTGFPGEPGNCAIAAHRARWFRDLPDIRIGDPVYVETPGWKYRYRVVETRTVTPNRSDLLLRGGDAELTLITCDAPSASAPFRILVFCKLDGTYLTNRTGI